MPIIFQQIAELLDGRKTNTRRVAKMDEQVVFSDGDVYSVAQLLEDPWYFQEMEDICSRTIREVWTPSGRVKWAVGQCQSIIPKRGCPALWLGPDGSVVEDWRADLFQLLNENAFRYVENADRLSREELLGAIGFQQPLMRIERIRLEHVQDISEEDAKAEGVQPIDSYRAEYFDGRELLGSYVAAYRELWRRINTRKGTRWEDRPLVFALDLKRVGRFADE